MSVSGEKIWLDGRFVDWADANIHLLTHTLHYGLGVFEGIRCYLTDDGRSAVFRLSEHVRRLYDSAKINLLEIPFTKEEIESATLETMPGASPAAHQLVQVIVTPAYSAASSPRSTLAALL